MLTPAILTTAFLAGLLGGAHCAGMCGGIMAALHGRKPMPAELSSASLSSPVFLLARADGTHSDEIRLKSISTRWHRDWPLEQAGRILGYMMAGALAGGLGGGLGGLAHLQGWTAVQAVLFGLMNLMLIMLGLRLLRVWREPAVAASAGAWLWRHLQPVANRIWPPRTPVQRVLFGLMWGWVPCGLVYGLLPLALLTGNPAHGAWLMLAFGLGTLPGLLTAGWGMRRLASLQHLGRRTWPRMLAGGMIVTWGLAGAAHATRVLQEPGRLLAYWCITAL